MAKTTGTRKIVKLSDCDSEKRAREWIKDPEKSKRPGWLYPENDLPDIPDDVEESVDSIGMIFLKSTSGK
jgi:hypothetical protein